MPCPDDNRRAFILYRHCRHEPPESGKRARDERPALSKPQADVDVLLLDKTGTITLGNRQAAEFIPVSGVTAKELADAAQLSSIADETPEGRSIAVLAKEQFDIRGRDLSALQATFIEFTAKTRMSGIDSKNDKIRKGAAEAVKNFVLDAGGMCGLTSARRS